MPKRDMRMNRRELIVGASAALLAGYAVAEEKKSPVAYGALATNALALSFETAPNDRLPDVSVVGPNGEKPLSDFFGKTILMPLWAEWCAPCLGEIPDFARLQTKYGNDKFAIVPVLSGTMKQVTPNVVADIFAHLHASVFTPWIEHNRGRQLVSAMARRNGSINIPCNLLIAPDGTVVAREIGLEQNDNDTTKAAKALADKGEPELVARAEVGESVSLWGQKEGEQFAAAMAAGFLSQPKPKA